jgi:TPR repeat protein
MPVRPSLALRAAAGDPAAQFKLARRLWQGRRRGAKRERDQAMTLYRSAARAGDREAQAALAQIHLQSDLPFYDVAAAFRWMTRAAERGHRGAQYFLGVKYATGEMVRLNSKKALYWYRKAAAAGNAEARYNIGMMYWGGEGVRKNPATARRWILKAARSAEMLAIILLAQAYETGELGFRLDRKKAKHWRELDRRLFGRPRQAANR